MIVVHDPLRLRPHANRCIIAIGVFDGVHTGHQAILREMVSHAAAEGLLSVAMTFEPHPDEVLTESSAMRLTSLQAKAGLMAALGVDALLAVPFDRQFAALPPDRFVREQLAAGCSPRWVYVGFNFTFGSRGQGNAHLLEQYGAELGFGVRVVRPLMGNGGVVSSTKIRDALGAGNLGLATRLLGRPYRLAGEVVSGDHRGSNLGFPTANVQPPQSALIPGPGVYAAWAALGGASWPAVVNVGRRPTFRSDGALSVEAHLLGFSSAIYGRSLEIIFIERLRDEMRFASAESLCAQIAEDIEQAKTFLRPSEAGGRRGTKV
jgi:riboflavin kinase / FMN adenylyltransferase